MDHYTQPDWLEESSSNHPTATPAAIANSDGDDGLDLVDTVDQSPLRGRVILLLSILSVVAVTSFGVQSVLGIFGMPDIRVAKSNDLNNQIDPTIVSPTPVRSDTTTVNTSEWTKYRNTIYGVGLRYPSNAQTSFSYEDDGFSLTIFLPDISVDVLLASPSAALIDAYATSTPTNVLLTQHASWNTYLKQDGRVAVATIGETPVIVSSDTSEPWDQTTVALIGTIEPITRENALTSNMPKLYPDLDWQEGNYEESENLYVGAEIGDYQTYLLPMTSYEAQVADGTRDIYTSFHDYYKQALEEQSWAYQVAVNGVRYTAPDAAGPMGEQIGWVYVSDGSVSVVMVEYWLCSQNVQDTCVNYGLHISDAVPLAELEQYRVE